MFGVHQTLLSVAAAAALAVAGIVAQTGGASAKGEPKEEPAVDCSKKKNKDNPKCKTKNHQDLSDDELYHAGYWLARRGEYSAAIEMLRKSRDMTAARVQTYIGFSLRKLGAWDEALKHYDRALTIDPDYVVARAYLGEAMLEQGDISRAKAELDEIERRCGTTCEEFVTLSLQIAKFEPRKPS